MNGIDRFVREAMPIQEEGEASGRPAAKARPMLKPSSASGWDFTPIERRQWTDIEIQESKDPYCFQVSKFLARLLPHSPKVHREDDGADQVIDERKKKQSDNTRSWSDEMKKHFVNAQHWSIENGYQFWQEVEDRRNSNYSQKFLYLRAIHGRSGSTINPALQDNVVSQEGFTEFFFITSETEKN